MDGGSDLPISGFQKKYTAMPPGTGVITNVDSENDSWTCHAKGNAVVTEAEP